MGWLSGAVESMYTGCGAECTARIATVLIWLVVGAGVFFLGATVGSFLNVVAYRLPRGRSPAAGRSHCPACGVQILAKDNVPVLSWVLLKGRCRACGAAISPRYPLVEAVCGLLFLLLALLDIALPEMAASGSGGGVGWLPFEADPVRLVRFGWHAAALSILLVAVLLWVDRWWVDRWVDRQ